MIDEKKIAQNIIEMAVHASGTAQFFGCLDWRQICDARTGL